MSEDGSCPRCRPARAAASLLLGLALIVPAHADDALLRRTDGRTFDQFVQGTLDAYGIPGAVVAVASDHGVVFLKGYGVRRHGAPEKIDPDTRFQIASMSKFIAATAVGTLVDRGIVAWDAPVHAYSPPTVLAVPYATENATLRDYFAHRTGLPAYTGDLLTRLGYDTQQLASRARFLAFDHSFRAEMAYSNYGIFLGQQAAAQAAHLTPPDLLSSAILRPVGMTRSGPTRAELFKDDNRAVAHDLDGSVMAYENVDPFSGAGAVVSTGTDIARWMQMMLADGKFEGRQILSSLTVAQLFAASMVQGVGGPLQDPNDSTGLGCESYHFLRYRVIEKNGALNGMRTIVTLVPERHIGISVFANKQLTVFPEAVRAEFLERELGPSGHDLQAEIHAQQPAWTALVDIARPPSDAKPLAGDLGALTGRYSSNLYGAVRIVQDGDALRLTIGPAAYPGRLTHWSGNTFLMTFADPDVAAGLLTFDIPQGVQAATGITGSSLPHSHTVDYGRFDRAS